MVKVLILGSTVIFLSLNSDFYHSTVIFLKIIRQLFFTLDISCMLMLNGQQCE